ncbi:hypothetical protein M426DRAFT_17408 [Hypoxylon sp. CI-4A]|nr:hypothetical protein M426DRAFT_17408 [Hypoxylon sp. CI-4A]
MALSTLYSHLFRRPLSRASARIPNRASTWIRDNIFVGRGATKHLSAVAASAPGSQSRNEGFHLDPPIYYPPNVSLQSGSRENTSATYPFYRPPPTVRRVSVQNPSVNSEAAAAAAEKVAGSGAEAEAVAVKTETDIEADPETVEPIPILDLSKKVHIIGFDPNARFVAQALSAVPELPPAQMLTHNTISMTTWGQEGGAVTILDTSGNPISSRDVLCPEYIGHAKRPWWRPSILDNVVVSTTSGAVLPTLYALRRCIDRRTTICLLQPELGFMELLNEQVFQDPAVRPNYVLAHSAHKFSRHSSYKYSLRHVPGKLFLHPVPRDYEDLELDQRTSEMLGRQHTEHMVSLLSVASDLDAVAVPWELLLRQKLPAMIFQSLADTISVILGCRFDQIRSDRNAMEFWDSMLHETMRIVSRLPEFQGHPDVLEYFLRDTFPKKLERKLIQQGMEYSRWISMVRKGQMPPVDFVNGYFVRRAKELGLNHTQNSLAATLVKARQRARSKELRLAIPLGLQPSMGDLDKIGGGQDGYDSVLDAEVDF